MLKARKLASLIALINLHSCFRCNDYFRPRPVRNVEVVTTGIAYLNNTMQLKPSHLLQKTAKQSKGMLKMRD